MNPQRQTITLSPAGPHLIAIESPCRELVHRLVTRTYEIRRGCSVGAVKWCLYKELADRTGYETMAGFEPVVEHLARQAGFAIRRQGPWPAALPAPDLAAVRQYGSADEGLLTLVRHHDRGIIRWGKQAGPYGPIAQIALSYLRQTIAIAVSRRDEARWLARQLRRCIADVRAVECGQIPFRSPRVVVGTFTSLGAITLEKRDIYIVGHAVESLGQRVIHPLPHLWVGRTRDCGAGHKGSGTPRDGAG
jgi:hypothetical protein